MTHNIDTPPLSSFSIYREASDYQDKILPQVSRTFALTIPQLPRGLREVVANAYLLCRIADTIEDEPFLSAGQKHHYENAFIDAVTGNIDAQCFASELSCLLSAETPEAERNLLQHFPLILQITHALKPKQRAEIIHCLKVMSCGMAEFQNKVSMHGLTTKHELDRYCYCVAGVVGAMLTKLIIDFEPELEVHCDKMLPLSVSFGTGLQLTNILKDQWEDRSRNICWLPQDIFFFHGVQLAKLRPGQQDSHYAAALIELIGLAHSHLRQALKYTLIIPARHAGIRRFCLWSVGLAILTLRNIYNNRYFNSGLQVKVSHKLVISTMVLTRLYSKYNKGLYWLFTIAAHSLPLTPLAENSPDSKTDLTCSNRLIMNDDMPENQRIKSESINPSFAADDYYQLRVSLALKNACSYFICTQHKMGGWEGEVWWCPLPTAQVVFTHKIIGHPITEEKSHAILQYFEKTQRPDGGWGLHAESNSYRYVTILVYVAARLLGMPSNAPMLQHANKWLFSNPGGVDSIPTHGKFWLAMLGLYDWQFVHIGGPEIFLMPHWFFYHQHVYIVIPAHYIEAWLT